MRILITGASGFVGRALSTVLLKQGLVARAAIRCKEKISVLPQGVEHCIVKDIGLQTDWTEALKNVDVIVHLAARVHVMKDNPLTSLSECRKINTEGTKTLAEAAVCAGVRKMIYLSTIKVNGEETKKQPFTEKSQPSPKDNYALSKWEAEQLLYEISRKKGLNVIIIRSPLIYGPGVGGNFLKLLSWVNKELFMLSAFANNRRSLIYVENLNNAIVACIKDATLSTDTFLISDGQDVSTIELAEMISSAMNKKVKKMPFSGTLLKLLGKLVNKTAEIERLTNSLCVNSDKIRKKLGWHPPYTMEDGICKTVKWFKEEYLN